MRLIFSAFPLLLSAISLIGWAIGSNQLRADFIAQTPMAPLAAIDLFVLSLLVILWPRGNDLRIIASFFMLVTAIVMASAAISLSQTVIAIYSDQGRMADYQRF